MESKGSFLGEGGAATQQESNNQAATSHRTVRMDFDPFSDTERRLPHAERKSEEPGRRKEFKKQTHRAQWTGEKRNSLHIH